jgi:hypothetical protein
VGIYSNQHPFGPPERHPWNDPLVLGDPIDPRPDAELALLGGGGPEPQDFPFDAAGWRDYYAAVRAEGHARQAQMEQIARARREEEEAAARRAAFLLLS